MRIFLIGYMGAGKTTVGKVLAQELNSPFIDMDYFIEEQYGTSITEIFADSGEQYFRNLEKESLNRLIMDNKKAIIATGGGTPCFNDNMEQMKQSSVTIYLSASHKTIYERVSRDAHRPLVSGKTETELKTYIKTHLKKRRMYYSQADIVVRSSGTPEEITQRILRKLP